MKDLLNSVYEHNLELLRDENKELRTTNAGLIEGNIVLGNRIKNLSKAKKPTKKQIEQIFDNYISIGLDDNKTTIIRIIEEWEKIRGVK